MNVPNDRKQINVQNVQPHKRANSQRGFTLIEILVVISIVAILASLAAPGFSSQMAKQRVRDSTADWRAILASAKAENAIRREQMDITIETEGAGAEAKNYLTLTMVPTTPSTGTSASCASSTCVLAKYQHSSNVTVTVKEAGTQTDLETITISKDKMVTTPADITICDVLGVADEGRKISINAVGNITISGVTC